MRKVSEHIETAIVSGPPGVSYGKMYSMHRYWSKKSPEVIAEFIEHYTDPGDLILDPFSGSGVTACEAVRLGRRAIAIDLNPVATFMTKAILAPVNLSRLKWAFRDVKAKSEELVNDLYITRCPKCNRKAVVQFVVRHNKEPKRIAYTCACTAGRQFKDPCKGDLALDRSMERARIPFWYPESVRLPAIREKQYTYLHELFTRRNLIALSIIYHTIEEIEQESIRHLMKLAFTAVLDKCSRMMPLAPANLNLKPTLQQGWIALRFYTPPLWEEVNPWYAFERSFQRVYEGKRDSNEKLKDAVLASSYRDIETRKANALVLTGSSEELLRDVIPSGSVDYVLTDPPFGDHIQYLALSTFWGGWLKFKLAYEKEVVVAPKRGKTMKEYDQRLGEVLGLTRRVMRQGEYLHIFWEDIRGPYLNKLVNLMCTAGIKAEKVVHQPPPSSFGAKVRERAGACGSYLVRGSVAKHKPLRVPLASREAVLFRVANAAKQALVMRGGKATIAAVLHSVFQKLGGEDLLRLAREDAERFVRESLVRFAVVEGENIRLIKWRHGGQESELESKVKRAYLDAKSLFGNDPKKVNQVRQRVLKRFQNEGLTLEDISSSEKEISFEQVGKHRITRFNELLCLLGRAYRFDVGASGPDKRTVSWLSGLDSTVHFKITDRHTIVSVSRRLPQGKVESDVGAIEDQTLERAMLSWCAANPNKASTLEPRLNPMGRTPEPPQPTREATLRVLENRKLCENHYLISLDYDSRYSEPRPGQFFHMICDPEGASTLEDGQRRGYELTLRRPLSAHRVHYKDFDRNLLSTRSMIPYEIKEAIQRPVSKIDFLYKAVGRGTQALSAVNVGNRLHVLGPLGNGFDIKAVDTAVIVAGGIGVAPLAALAERLRYLGIAVRLYLGAQNLALLRPVLTARLTARPDPAMEDEIAGGTPRFLRLIKEEFKAIGADPVKVCTDDGTVGIRGLVVDILKEDLKEGRIGKKGGTVVYACGPYKMLKAVSALASAYGLPCQVLLEERMACGIGACLSCTCRVKLPGGGTRKCRVCADGPVFEAGDVVWPT
jgi:NAD(P)H-flavin reductase/16S rRNA G966 N2-methylase RsmD